MNKFLEKFSRQGVSEPQENSKRQEISKIHSKRLLEFLKVFVYLALTSLILLWPSFWNGYPLVFSDTGTYIHSGFTLEVPFDRPIGYGLFIRFFSLGVSLWFVVYAQAFFAVYLLWKVLSIFIQKKLFVVHFLAVLGLALFSTLPWMVSQLMPDIFPGLILLTLFVFVAGEISLGERVFLVLFIISFLVTHSANFLLSIGGLAVMVLVLLFKKDLVRDRMKYFQRIGVMTVISLMTPLFFLISNYHQGYGFVLSPASYIFMMARVNDSAVLDQFLQQNCETVHYFLCNFQGRLPLGEAFIWNSDSPLTIQGWLNAKPEYNSILQKVFTTPAFVLKFGEDSVLRTFQLFLMTGLESYLPYDQKGPVYPQIEKYFPGELYVFTHARQYRAQVQDVSVFALMYMVAALVSFLMLAVMLFKKMLRPLEKFFVYEMLIFLFINAAVMATLSGVYGRYQDRIVWLLPFVVFVFITRIFQSERAQV